MSDIQSKMKALTECQRKCQPEALNKINQIPGKHIGELMKLGAADAIMDISKGDVSSGLRKGTDIVKKPEFKDMVLRMIQEYMDAMKKVNPQSQADCVIERCDPETISYMTDIITFFISASKILADKDVKKSLKELDQITRRNMQIVEKEIIPRYRAVSEKKTRAAPPKKK